MALCLLLRLFVFRLLRLKRFSTLTLKFLCLIPILLATLFCMATCRRVKLLGRMFSVLVIRLRFFFSSRRRHTRYWRDWSSDVCSSDLVDAPVLQEAAAVGVLHVA